MLHRVIDLVGIVGTLTLAAALTLMLVVIGPIAILALVFRMAWRDTLGTANVTSRPRE